MSAHNLEIEELHARADALAAVLGTDEAYPDGARYYVSECLRDVLREMKRLAHSSGDDEEKDQ